MKPVFRNSTPLTDGQCRKKVGRVYKVFSYPARAGVVRAARAYPFPQSLAQSLYGSSRFAIDEKSTHSRPLTLTDVHPHFVPRPASGRPTAVRHPSSGRATANEPGSRLDSPKAPPFQPIRNTSHSAREEVSIDTEHSSIQNFRLLASVRRSFFHSLYRRSIGVSNKFEFLCCRRVLAPKIRFQGYVPFSERLVSFDF